jgi:hypothetical protein
LKFLPKKEEYSTQTSAIRMSDIFELLTPEEAVEQGLPIINPTSTKKIGILCGGISTRFKEYIIMTTAKQITQAVKNGEKRDEQQRKRIWVSILRELTKYTDEELHAHYEATDQEWRNWCDDAVLFYAYNTIIFKKGIPSVELSAEQKKRAH